MGLIFYRAFGGGWATEPEHLEDEKRQGNGQESI